MPNAYREAQNLLGRQTAVLPFAMRPMPLGVVILHEAVMRLYQFLPALGLSEVEVGHPTLDVERRFYVTLPGPSALYLMLCYPEGLVDVRSLLGAEDLRAVGDQRLRGAVPLDRRVETAR